MVSTSCFDSEEVKVKAARICFEATMEIGARESTVRNPVFTGRLQPDPPALEQIRFGMALGGGKPVNTGGGRVVQSPAEETPIGGNT